MQNKFLNRDLSWLEFNSRVLDEAADRENPLLERMKFIAIFSSNLDEFFMVRMAGIIQQLEHPFHTVYEYSGLIPAELVNAIGPQVRRLTARQSGLLFRSILPAAERSGIRLLKWETLPETQKKSLRKEFLSRIVPVLTPVEIDPERPFPLIPNLGLELLIRLVNPGEKRERYAVMEIPSVLPRFIRLEKRGDGALFLPLEELISHNLDMLFNRSVICECSVFRITRDMDFPVDADPESDPLKEIRTVLRQKIKRRIVRLEISSGMSRKSCRWLSAELGVCDRDVFTVSGLLDLRALHEISGMDCFPALKDPPLPPLPSIHLLHGQTVCGTIRRNGAFLLHHPFESFDPVIRFLEEAADDPDVFAIKQTLYRISGESAVVKALIRAARNGKQVSVLVELRARFDEDNNINWARKLNNAGIHVLYGLPGLKVHCKTLLVERRENNGIHRYMHLGTGNYNESTGKLYTDLGLFTDDPHLGSDVSSLFDVMAGGECPPVWKRFLIAPFNMLERLLFFIDREAEFSSIRNPGSITIKVNSVTDNEVIEHLYAAARKHVKIMLIVRGACGINPCFLPKKYRNNIVVVSILDRFLEHSRIYRFGNNGHPEYFLGSADMMSRNLRRRIEVLFPVEQNVLRKELDFILECALNDRRKGRRLIGPGLYSSVSHASRDTGSRSQLKLYNFYKERLENH